MAEKLPYSPKYTQEEFEQASFEIEQYNAGTIAIDELSVLGIHARRKKLQRVDFPVDISKMHFPDIKSVANFSDFWNSFLHVYARAAQRLIADGTASDLDLQNAQQQALGAVVWWKVRADECDPFEKRAFNTFENVASAFPWQEHPDFVREIASSTRTIGETLKYFAMPTIE